MNEVGSLHLTPLRDFRMKAPVPAFPSEAELSIQDQFHFTPLANVPAPVTEHLLESLAPSPPLPPAPPVPKTLVDLGDPQLNFDFGPEPVGTRPMDTRAPAVLTQFDPQSGNQTRIDQEAFQSSLQLDLGGPQAARLQNVDNLSEPNGRLPGPAELSKLSQAFYDQSQIPFEYIKDGCYARAHLMCESLRQHGINHSKVWVFGQLGAKNEHQDTKWWYHVAPMVFVQDPETGAVDARVVDPGLSREPIPVQDWVKACNRGGEVRIDLTDPAQYVPREGKGVQKDFAENLPYAQRVLLNYSAELERIAPDRIGPERGADMASSSQLFPEGLPPAAETISNPRQVTQALDRLMANFAFGVPLYGGMIGGMMMGGYGDGMTMGYSGKSLMGMGWDYAGLSGVKMDGAQLDRLDQKLANLGKLNPDLIKDW